MAGTRVLTKYSLPSRGPLLSLWVSLCQVLGAIFCFASPASFPPSLCPLGVTGIPKVLPTSPHLSWTGPSSCRRAAGWQLQAAGCFTSLYFWLLLTSYFLQ